MASSKQGKGEAKVPAKGNGFRSYSYLLVLTGLGPKEAEL